MQPLASFPTGPPHESECPHFLPPVTELIMCLLEGGAGWIVSANFSGSTMLFKQPPW